MFIFKSELEYSFWGYCSKRYVKIVNTAKVSVGVEVICSKKKKKCSKINLKGKKVTAFTKNLSSENGTDVD